MMYTCLRWPENLAESFLAASVKWNHKQNQFNSKYLNSERNVSYGYTFIKKFLFNLVPCIFTNILIVNTRVFVR